MTGSANGKDRTCEQAPAPPAALKWKAAELRFRISCMQMFLHLYFKANFDPAQRRIPAGQPGGGQWTDDASDPADQPTRLAQDRTRRYDVDLLQHEGRAGAHSIKNHVGKTDAELMARMETGRWYTLLLKGVPLRDGSFASLGDANHFVNDVLESNRASVDLVASGKLPEIFLNKRFGFRTGREAFRPDLNSGAYMRTTYEVGVYIVHDPSMPHGFLVHTSYPRNSLPGNIHGQIQEKSSGWLLPLQPSGHSGYRNL